MLSIVALVIFASHVLSDPQLIPLKKFTSIGGTQINGVENDVRLYLASNDDNAVLRNIKITSGVTTITLDKLNDYNNDGSPKFITVSDVYIETTNDDTTTGKLTGSLYLTTYNQAKDPNFYVYVVKDSHIASQMTGRSTGVVLNTQYLGDSPDVDAPMKTTYVTGIDHSSNSPLYFAWGIPSHDWLGVTNQTFYRNPIVLNNYDDKGNLYNSTQVFFDQTDPLQINLDIWYFLAMGPVNMQLENKYVSNHQYTTTYENATGLIMNNFIYKQHVVNFKSDETHARTSGFYASTFITGDLGIYLESDKYIISNRLNRSSENQSMGWSPFGATKFTVNSTVLLPGTFYCQYFVFSGDLLPLPPATTPVTTPTTATKFFSTTTTTTTVATTTKEAGTLVNFQMVVILLLSLMFH